jgi:hypothetical protein
VDYTNKDKGTEFEFVFLENTFFHVYMVIKHSSYKYGFIGEWSWSDIAEFVEIDNVDAIRYARFLTL